MGLFSDIYNTVAKFFRPQEEQGDASKSVATNRLKLVLMQDRTNLTPKILEQMRGELIDLLSRYVELDKELLELNFEQEGEQVALMLSIPVIRAKDEEEIEAALKEEAEKLAHKHFIAVTDGNAEKSELRRTSNEQGWLGDLFIHDDVGGRFSAFDDHALFTLAYAGMKKEDMVVMLNAAQEISSESLTADSSVNDALKEGIFWAHAKMNGILTSVHQYMGSIFENTVYWHAQMQNESVKDTLKQVAKVPDAMHHSAEAHFNPANKFAFALTVPQDNGVCRENAESYVEALTKSYEVTGAFFLETAKTLGMGLTPAAAGALTQLRAFATVYQEIVEKVMENKEFPEVLDSVLQPHVEFYKKNLKGGVVVPGRIS